jgi:hypothetical protein
VAAEHARRELARRELARREFASFCSYALPVYPAHARHLQALNVRLQKVERFVATGGREGVGRLMVNMPPQYWKSTTTSVLFPAWFMGRNPQLRVIVTSYNASLAMDFSRQARDLMLDEPYRKVFGDLAYPPGDERLVTVAKDSRSVESWNLAGHYGGLRAAGVGGGISGKPGHLVIIDDPFKDRAEAESKARRDAVWNWYTSAAYMRLQKGSAIIVIQTRWHADDLSGRLLQAMANDPKADWWSVLSMPALALDPKLWLGDEAQAPLFEVRDAA